MEAMPNRVRPRSLRFRSAAALLVLAAFVVVLLPALDVRFGSVSLIAAAVINMLVFPLVGWNRDDQPN